MKLHDFLTNEGWGSATALARAINAHAPDILRWASYERPCPVRRAIQIERATQGQVTRKDLRPDDWHEIWPELADSD